MDFLLYSIVFIFGTIIGSFLNVVIYRYNTGVTLGGRSKCFSCAKTLSWYELVPIFSFILQRGKCSDCKSKISIQYPAIELLTGILFVAILATSNVLQNIQIISSILEIIPVIYFLLIASLLIVITVYDLHHMIIPNGLVYAFILLAFFALFIDTSLNFVLPNTLDLLAGPILATPFALLWLLSHGKWMGFGDAKLALGIGWALGLYAGISAIIFAFWTGAIVGVFLLILKSRAFTMKSEIAFGPFLIFGMAIVWFFGVSVIPIF